LSNLYALTAPSDSTAMTELERQVARELQATTTEDNTHPSPKDRFRLGERLHSSTVYQADGYVWELFQDPAGITAEMTSLVAKRIGGSAATRITPR
jgi:hypothetical protein